MKLFVLIISIVLFIVCTKFPEIKSNVTEEDKSKSIIFNLFKGKKDFLIAYSTESYWWSNRKMVCTRRSICETWRYHTIY